MGIFYMKSKLFNKIIQASIQKLPKEIRSCPKASSFDFISGTGPKGDFEIYSFFDGAGSLIKRNRLYKQGDNITKEISYYRNYNQNYVDCGNAKVLQITTYKEVNGQTKSCKKAIQWGDFAKTEEEILQGTSYSSHKMLGLKKGKKPKEISYKTNWDGNIPYEVQIKGGEFVLPDGSEYIPLFISPQNPKRYQHLEQIALNQQELQGVVPKVKVMTRKSFYDEYPYVKAYEKAHEQKTGEKAFVWGNACPETGQVRIINDQEDITELVDTFAHEYQHVRDSSDEVRTQHALANILKQEKNGFKTQGFKINIKLNDFQRKSLEKGVIEKNSDEYNRIINSRWIDEHENYHEMCSNGQHDDAFTEVAAIQKGTQEKERFNSCINKIFEFLVS